jgi:hypothetical protein
VTIGAVLVVAVLVGGITQVGRQSGPFNDGMNRSFALQGAVLVQQSNGTAASLRHLLSVMPQQGRQDLEVELDSLVAGASQQATGAAALAAPGAAGGVAGEFAAVFSDRAEAVAEVRSAIDGLLGLHPLPVAGSPTSSVAAVAKPALLSSTEATNRIAAAGALLTRSDQSYRSLRHRLPGLAGQARLPASRWITDANLWQLGAVATQVDLVAASPSLAAIHLLALSAIRITPPALPPPNGVVTPTVSILSPTGTVSLSVVLSNLGSVDETHAGVRFTLVPQPSGATATVTRSAAIASQGSVTLSPASFRVKPGTSYQLTVAVLVPAGQTDLTGTSFSQTLQIAPQ